MSDLTLLLATANVMPEKTAKKIRDYVIEVTENQYPIISVSQEPIDFGKNMCLGRIGVSKYNEFLQILLGAKQVQTKYVAVIDDDALYSPDHFKFRPPDDVFAYEINYWFAQTGKDYYWRASDFNSRGGMWGCITTTSLLVHNLETRYKLYPDDKNLPPFWGEPGGHDKQFGMENRKMRFESATPSVVFVHADAMGYRQLSRFYRRYGQPTGENKVEFLEQFGSMEDLHKKYGI